MVIPKGVRGVFLISKLLHQVLVCVTGGVKRFRRGAGMKLEWIVVYSWRHLLASR